MEFSKRKKFGKYTSTGLGLSKQDKLQIPLNRFYPNGPMQNRITENFNFYGQYIAEEGSFICKEAYKGYITKNNLFFVREISEDFVILISLYNKEERCLKSKLKDSFNLTEEQFNEASSLFL